MAVIEDLEIMIPNRAVSIQLFPLSSEFPSVSPAS
jgi:hypothetical protein